MLVWLRNIDVQIETDTETRSEGFSKIYVTAACSLFTPFYGV
jgi:hypothetical protein